ncbi:MAG: DUF1684 domain-containing protein [Chloroflexales bacterium]
MTIDISTYTAEIAAWRAATEAPLRRDWISLVGRFELQPGLNRIGSDLTSEIVLPTGSAPEHVGVLNFNAGEVTLGVAPGVTVAVNGAPVEGTARLRSDADTKQVPDIITVGSVTFFIIARGPRTLVRVRDANSPELALFGGRRWLPVDEAYRVEGVFTPYNPPKPLAITNLLGDTSTPTSPGVVSFTLGGKAHQLDATGWREGGLVLHFRDTTNGELTYGGGRALITAPPVGGLVTLDFNRTSNLPCAFTEFATCPLPPQQNRLSIRVEAGELSPTQK